jgi:hypothetical protein
MIVAENDPKVKPEFLTVEQIAARLQVSEAQIYRWARERKIEHVSSVKITLDTYAHVLPAMEDQIVTVMARIGTQQAPTAACPETQRAAS